MRGGAKASSILTESLTGTITGGGQGSNGAFHPNGWFGGGDLLATTATLSFSIDLGALATCVAADSSCRYYSYSSSNGP